MKIDNPDFSKNIDVVINLFQILNCWGKLSEKFEELTKQSLINNELNNLENSQTKIFFVKYFRENLKDKSKKNLRENFHLIKTNLFQLIKIFLIDKETGVFEITANLLIGFYTEKNLLEILPNENSNNFTKDNLILDSIDFIDKTRENNSTLIIRELEIIFNFLEKFSNCERSLFHYMKKDEKISNFSECFENNLEDFSQDSENFKNDSIEKNLNFMLTQEIIMKYFFRICDLFYEVDQLGQLNYFDLAEKNLTKAFIVKLFVKKLDFFMNLNSREDISDAITRKAIYTYSKLYGKGLLEMDRDVVIKNILAVAIHFFRDNPTDNYFIITTIINCLHNKKLFGFLVSEESNKNYNFQEEVISVIIENLKDHHPEKQILNLELLGMIANFELPSLYQEIFLKKLVEKIYIYEYDSNAENDNIAYKYFIERLYKNFRVHDFEDYEAHFLDMIYCKIFNFILFKLAFVSCEILLKVILSHFDFVMYLVNRRERHETICLRKYGIIERIVKSGLADSGKIDNTLLEQFKNYLVKGPK